jgi:alkanesulfonate monooxygenase SsuD/methylene tetrahydromethanopterin reductase-like flavin-dependent oxidoreductase (luciferase family)
MPPLSMGVALWSQAADWPGFLAAAQRVDRLGFDHIWTWDYLYAIFGDPLQPIFEGHAALAAVAQATERIRLGLFVGANTFRNPGLAAKSLVTIDHISGGRAIMGLGGAWFGREHEAYGLEFGAASGSGSTGWRRRCRPPRHGRTESDPRHRRRPRTRRIST